MCYPVANRMNFEIVLSFFFVFRNVIPVDVMNKIQVGSNQEKNRRNSEKICGVRD